ncbi:MAG: PH domain-containing protein [bacterium]|nr:PH domain-containing protein [bacterium]
MKVLTEKDKKKYQRYLAVGEELVSVFGIGEKYFWINTAVYFPLAFLLIGMPGLLKVFHLRHSKTYLLTNRRILIKDGVFNISLTTAPYDKITHITVRDKFLNRISYGIGDLVVHTAASGSLPVEIVLEKVSQPVKLKNLIEELIYNEKQPHVIKESLVKKL